VTSVISVAAVADRLSARDDVEPSHKPANFDWSQLIQAPPTTADQRQRDSFTSFAEALATESFSEAEIAAKRSVELVNADARDNAVDTALARARALQNLAIAQQFQGNHESAKQNYAAALSVIASEDTNLSPALILPLSGLAIAYLDTGRPDQGFAAIDRALHISNVNYGPHSLEQLPILTSKMQVYLDRDDQRSALELVDRIQMLYSRRYAWDAEEMLPAVYQQAELYGQFNMLAEERAAWRHVLAIKQAHYAENDLALIEPNIRLAENFIRELRKVVYRSGTTPTAEKHLKTALWIAKDSPDADWQTENACLLALADYYTLVNVGSRAHYYYVAAWELLSSNEAYLAGRAQSFSKPVALARPRPDPYANFQYNPDRDEIDPDDYLEGEIVMDYTVNVRGRTQDLRIVAASPPDFAHMERRVRNSVKEFVYRPRYADGVAVETTNQQYRVKYFYLPSEYRASVAKSGKLSHRPRQDPY
jgi:hypothetical protein